MTSPALDRGTAAISALRGPVSVLAAFAVGYTALLVAELSIAVDTYPSVALSAGVAIGFIARVAEALRLWLVGLVVLLTAGVEIAAGTPMTSAVAGAAITGLLAMAAAAGIRRFPELCLPRWEGLFALVGVGFVFATVQAAVVAVASELVGDRSPLASTLLAWTATCCGVVLATPAVLMARKSRVPITAKRTAELLCAAVATAAVLALVVIFESETVSDGSRISLALVPLALWFAIRFGLAMTSGVVSLMALTLLAATYVGVGDTGSTSAQIEALISMNLMVTVVALAVFAVAINEEQRRNSDLELFAVNGLVNSLVSNSDAMISIVSYDASGNARYALANPRFAKTLGVGADDIVGRRQDDLAPDPQAAARMFAEDQSVIESGHSQVFVTRAKVAGSSDARVHLVTKFPVAGFDKGSAVGSVAVDITDHRRRERLMRLTFDESPVPMMRLAWLDGHASRVLDANRSAAELLQLPPASLLGRSLMEFTHPGERAVELISADGRAGQARRREARLVRADGTDVWVMVTASVVEAHTTEDEVIGEEDQFALVVFEDISARKAAEQTLTHQALHDALTGVLNRYALIDRLESALSRLWRRNNHIAVLFCDLDGFKNLNDTLGHRAGDQLLISVSQRLRDVMRPQDTVARLGGDEFVLVCEDLPSPSQARIIGERIREEMRRPFPVDGRDYGVTVSVGIATTTNANTKAEDLLRQADLAMYRAKDAGRNRVEYYAEELEAKAVAHVEATETLRKALEDRQVVVHYQPIIDTISGAITGVEALARLRAPDGSLIHPNKFIAVAESSGLVTVMGEQVLDQAIDQLQSWVAAGFEVQMNVNVSPRQLSRASFAPTVFERLITRSLPPHSLCLEVTEGAVVDATGPTLITLRRLRSYGVHVAIDDFGTGYSSLTTLKYLPADVLKVDRSFVEGLGTDANDSAIVAAVIKVAHDLGCVVVAEGVESERQISLLQSMNCDQVQGYRYGRPVSADQMTEMLSRGTAVPVEIDLTDSSDLRSS